ncbi:MAG: NUDIX domain-containing protein [Nocardioides sp.]|nr:NUDIX domain-containing protein [Nocardioides sp.]
MDPTRSLPPDLLAAAREYAAGDRTPVEPKAASTVVLLREGDGRPGGLDVYLLRRHVGMEFAAGMCVFPGGGVDARDAEIGDDFWVGPSVAEWAGRMDCSEDEARELVCAAVRETFEESGVLLAGTAEKVVEDTTGEDWEADRRALVAHEISLTSVLERRGLLLRTDLLSSLGGWLTPVFEPKRYRTWFFVAALPEGQATRDVSSESDKVTWLPVRDAIRAVDADDMLMLPPTYATCCEMYDACSTDEAMAHVATLPHEMIEPTADPSGSRLVVPDRLVQLGIRVGEELAR